MDENNKPVDTEIRGWDTRVVDFGQVGPGEKYDFSFKYSGEHKPLVINDVVQLTGTCPCTVLYYNEEKGVLFGEIETGRWPSTNVNAKVAKSYVIGVKMKHGEGTIILHSMTVKFTVLNPVKASEAKRAVALAVRSIRPHINVDQGVSKSWELLTGVLNRIE